MGMENKFNLIMAVNGYKSVKKQRNAKFTDVTALDTLNKKVLLRVIDSLSNECVVFNDIKSMEQSIEQENCDSGFLISKKFTSAAVEEMTKQRIQYASDDHMPPFKVEKLYLAIVSCANNQCQKKCGKDPSVPSDCSGKEVADSCRLRNLVENAKGHFEEGLIGLLKNDLMIALALNR